MGAYYTEMELWFSSLYGGAVYQRTGETGERLAAAVRERGVSRGNAPGISFLPSAGTSPVLTNLAAGEQVLEETSDGLVTIELKMGITLHTVFPETGYVSHLTADSQGNVAAVKIICMLSIPAMVAVG